MRHYCFTLFAILLSGATGLAQPATTPPPAAQDLLVPVLQRWEKEMSKVETLAARCVRTDLSKTFGNKEVYEGGAHYMKLVNGEQVTNLALLHMERKSNKEIFERYICTGEAFYQYVPQAKEIRFHKLPAQQPGQVADDNFLPFIFGMKAATAQQRYEMTLSSPEDQNYYYLMIRPRNPRDRADFTIARLALRKDNFMPAQLWFKEPNSDEHTWDIPKIQINVQIDRKEFMAPDVPPGWKMVSAKETEAKPRIYRPHQ